MYCALILFSKCVYLPPYSSASFDSEVVGGDMNNLPQDGIMMDMDMAMDTGESFSDLLDIIKGDSTGEGATEFACD